MAVDADLPMVEKSSGDGASEHSDISSDNQQAADGVKVEVAADACICDSAAYEVS